MAKLSKKRLLKFARREKLHFDIENPRHLIMTKDTELRFKAMKNAEARKFCPFCGAQLKNEMFTSCRGRFKDWMVRKECPNCGIIEETESGVRRISGYLKSSKLIKEDFMKRLFK